MKMKSAIRPLIAAPLGLTVALLVSCGSSSTGLIPATSAGPLQRDFEAVEQAAQAGNGQCGETEAAIRSTERHFLLLPLGRSRPARNAQEGDRKPPRDLARAVRTVHPREHRNREHPDDEHDAQQHEHPDEHAVEYEHPDHHEHDHDEHPDDHLDDGYRNEHPDDEHRGRRRRHARAGGRGRHGNPRRRRRRRCGRRRRRR